MGYIDKIPDFMKVVVDKNLSLMEQENVLLVLEKQIV